MWSGQGASPPSQKAVVGVILSFSPPLPLLLFLSLCLSRRFDSGKERPVECQALKTSHDAKVSAIRSIIITRLAHLHVFGLNLSAVEPEWPRKALSQPIISSRNVLENLSRAIQCLNWILGSLVSFVT